MSFQRSPLSYLLAGISSLPVPPRQFEFIYRFTITPPPDTRRLQIWVPLAANTQYQRVTLLKAEGPIRWRETSDPVFNNPMLSGEVLQPPVQPLEVALHFRVVRAESYALASPETNLSRYLMPDRLVPLDTRFQEMARQIAGEKTTALEKARALYDFVLGYMAYDKSGTGWGRGDAVYACDVRRGNCTDFHSLFIALARSLIAA